jgi:RNA polymerase sigma-70 factor, ECF subfamily
MSRVSSVPPDVDAGLCIAHALRRGEPDADDRLVERYGERVYRVAAHLVGTRAAEEVTQSALAAAVRTIDTFEGACSFDAWMDRLAARAAYRSLLALPRKTAEVALDDVLPAFDDAGRHFAPMQDWSGEIDEPALQSPLRRSLTDALEALPPDYRAALVLRDVEGMSAADVAEILGTDLEAVRSRVHRARLFVRRSLSDQLGMS